MALCVAFALGPLTGGAIIEVLNFEYLLLICGVINLGTNFKLSTFLHFFPLKSAFEYRFEIRNKQLFHFATFYVVLLLEIGSLTIQEGFHKDVPF